jgi:hypothetical protein
MDVFLDDVPASKDNMNKMPQHRWEATYSLTLIVPPYIRIASEYSQIPAPH